MIADQFLEELVTWVRFRLSPGRHPPPEARDVSNGVENREVGVARLERAGRGVESSKAWPPAGGIADGRVARPESEGAPDKRYYAFLTSVLEKSSPLNSSGNPERFAKA